MKSNVSECRKKAKEHRVCMELVDLWTWDDDVGECVHFKDCVGPYGQLEENVYNTQFECERNCAHF